MRSRSASARAAVAGSPPLRSWAATIEREAVTRARRPAGGDGGREVLHAPALGTDPGEEEHRSGHELPRPPEVLGCGGADHGPDVAEPGPRGTAGLAQLRDQACDTSPRGPSLGERRVLEVGGAGVGRAHEDEDAGARRTGGTGEHFHGVASQVGACRERVGSQPLDGAEGRRGRPDERLAVGGRRHVDVAPLGVREHEQPGRLRVGDDVRERGPPGCAQALEAGDLRLDGHARGPGGVDDRAAVRGDRDARTLRGAASGPARAGRAGRRGPQPHRVGVQAEDDLGLTAIDEHGQTVREGRPPGRPAGRDVPPVSGHPGVSHAGPTASGTERPSRRRARRHRPAPTGTAGATRTAGAPEPGRRSGVDGLLEAGARREARDLRRGDVDGLARPRMHALARAALGHAELAEAGEGDVAARSRASWMVSSTASTASPACFLSRLARLAT